MQKGAEGDQRRRTLLPVLLVQFVSQLPLCGFQGSLFRLNNPYPLLLHSVIKQNGTILKEKRLARVPFVLGPLRS